MAEQYAPSSGESSFVHDESTNMDMEESVGQEDIGPAPDEGLPSGLDDRDLPGQGLSDEELRVILVEKDKLVTQLEDELRRLNTQDLSGRIRQLEEIIKLQGAPVHIKAPVLHEMREALMEDEKAKRKEAKESLRAIDLHQDVEEVDEVDPFHEDPPTYVGHMVLDAKIRCRTVASTRRGPYNPNNQLQMQNRQPVFGSAPPFMGQDMGVNGQMPTASGQPFSSLYGGGANSAGVYLDQRRSQHPMFLPQRQEKGIWDWVAGTA